MANKKDKGLRIRIEEELREEFLAACRAQDKSAAEVLREFMRAYVIRQAGGKQTELFMPLSQKQ